MKKALAISASLHLLAGVCLVYVGSKLVPPYLPGKFIDITFVEIVKDPPAAVDSPVELAAPKPPPPQTSNPDSPTTEPVPEPLPKTTRNPPPTLPIEQIQPPLNTNQATNASPIARISEPQPEPTSGPNPLPVAENTHSLADTPTPSAPQVATKSSFPTTSPSPLTEDSTETRPLQKAVIGSPSTNPDIIPPQNVRSFKPIYPSTARRQGYEGEVLLQATITTNGKPQDVSVKQSSGFEVLDHAAIRCLKRWRFTPALRAGTPVEWRVEIPLIFKLN